MIISTIQDILLHLNIKIEHCRGSGVRSDVATQLLGQETRAFCTHYYEHALNLATQDALKVREDYERCLG